MAQPQVTEGVTENVVSILFSPMTDDAVRKLSFKKITNPVAFTGLGRPTDGGLYDPALGPLDDNTLCRSCGQRSFLCPGHCGHIDLVLPVYNPLLFRDLQLILKQTCFYCRRFKMKEEKVKIFAKMLECIVSGNIVDARKLISHSTIGNKLKEMLEIDDSVDEMDTSSSLDEILSDNMTECLEDNRWTSLQNDMLKNALNKFWGFNRKKCENCNAEGPKIRALDFCWFHMEMKVSGVRGNILRGKTMNLVDKDSAAIAFGKDVDSDVEGLSRESSIFQNGEISEDETSGCSEDKKDVTDKALDEFLKQTKFFSGHLLPIKAREMLQELWNNEGNILQLIFDIQRHDIYMSGESKSHLMFFMETVLVPANKFRPPSKGGTGSVMEHPQSAQLSKVLQSNVSLTNFYANNSFNARTIRGWMDLQETVSVFVDSKKAMRQRDNTGTGISELLEKKAGIFRQKMMGKRVNFACRSVISPDPYLAVNEIGIPPYFALRLTYPERVTSWNASKLRQYVINGSELHPGATHYLEKSITIKLPAARNKRVAISRKLSSSRVFTHSERSGELENEGKVVYRHLKDGDIVLVNRQPTLHKPSMMAHVVRVLKGEKTIRMHYANCSTYNADFDGDEMNVHFPQDEISRAEAMNIVNANQQFTVPTSGDPIRGLIQDHIISAVLLTKKDTFVTREEYHQLLYASFVSKAASNSVNSGWSKKIYTVSLDDEMHPVPPAIWKPKPLWTGKQVITTILNHITKGKEPFTIKKVGRIPRDYFGPTSGETKLLIRQNEFLRGVIDKAQFGKYGLIHSVQELYGSDAAGLLLSMLSRLFTGFLQVHGFTCGVNDLLVVKSADKERASKLTRSENIGKIVYSQFLGLDYVDLDPMELQSEIERKIRSDGESAIATLDRMMSSALNRLTSEVNNDLFPKGLSKPFPSNCLSLMTTTGAKGSLVNLTQISSLLGQQELEGKRVPRMVSGKTLPCFPPWDSAARAGGFICDRFLTGLRPQEYYFHCMAGREGLVDTAVKTSRSGYLQRCLIKNLESLKVCYDHTVRDADGTVIQFCYGEDGVDVQMSSYLSEFKMIADNKEVVHAKLNGRLEDANVLRSNNYLMKLPLALKEQAENFFCNVIKKKRDHHKLKKSTFLNLVKFKYFSSLAQPGEAVGVIAAQSVGEPSTQMTLNTFHLAGRGEMNVTLGIPRLQEILMRASEVIQTPVMTCPLLKGKTRLHAERLAAKLKKVTVADIVESMEVDVLPFALCGMEVGLVYVLKIRLYDPNSYFPHSNITLHDCYTTLVTSFLQKLEDMIKLHVKKFGGISDVSDITGSDFPEKVSKGKSTDESQAEDAESAGVDDDDNADANDDNEDGVDAWKRKSQKTDEINYDDDIEKEASMIDSEQDERNMLMMENNIDEVESDLSLGGAGQTKEGKNAIFNSEDETDESTSQLRPSSNLESRKEENIREGTAEYFRSNYIKKEKDRLLDFDIEGLDFKACFYLKGEPHILMAKIAQQAASKVYVKSSGKIERCSVIELNGDPNKPAIQTAGVNFQLIWGMDEVIDVNNIITNDIHSVLKTYGVEAARATIINEIKGVFGLYGISVNTRHLTLIADYMTVDGGYRPMSRYGIDSSTSPFSKMTFETASQFMKNAALHGEVERLESPSSRICVGLPVKLGTGCFDLMHNLQV